MVILIVIISLSILILVHEFGHFLAAKIFGVRVDEFGLGFPPKLFGKKIGETIYSVNLLPFGGFVKIYGEDGNEADLPAEVSAQAGSQGASETLVSETPSFREARIGSSFINQPFLKKSVIILAGVFMNIILGWFVLSIIFMVGAPEHLMISAVQGGSPAKIAGLKESDVILSAKFNEVTLTDPIKSGDFIGLVKSAEGKIIEIKIKRAEGTLNFSLKGRLNPPPGEGSLGLNLSEIGFQRESVFKSFGRGLQTSWLTLKLVAVGFFDFLSKIFVSPKVIQTITGPVGIFKLAAESGSLGLIYVFELMAFISLNLAVLNLFPFPALDGGRFLFLIIEKIKGSPLPKRFQSIVNAIGFAALILLMVVVTIQDISKLLK